MLESRYDLIRQILMINIVHTLAVSSITLSKKLSRDGCGLTEEPGLNVNLCSPGSKTPTLILNISLPRFTRRLISCLETPDINY